jgi:hypothetical protein
MNDHALFIAQDIKGLFFDTMEAELWEPSDNFFLHVAVAMWVGHFDWQTPSHGAQR